MRTNAWHLLLLVCPAILQRVLKDKSEDRAKWRAPQEGEVGLFARMHSTGMFVMVLLESSAKKWVCALEMGLASKGTWAS